MRREKNWGEPTQFISVRMPVPDYDVFKELCWQERYSMNQMVCKLIKAHLDSIKTKTKPAKKA